jgi:4-hydroxybenzoate polyprenyltransferase
MTGADHVRALLATMAWPAAAATSLAVALWHTDATSGGLLLVACGTMAAYGLDRLIDRRELDPPELRRTLRIAVLLAAVGTGVLACSSWWRFRACAVLAVMAGGYVPLKRHIPKNVLTTVAWTTAVATLPGAGSPPADAAFGASVLAVAAIMAANTILCDVPDVEADRRAGVRGITPRLGARAGSVVAAGFGVAGTLVAVSAGRWGLALTATTLAVLAIALGRRPERLQIRRLADAVVTVLPGPLAMLLR